jgi:hypothetical protein
MRSSRPRALEVCHSFDLDLRHYNHRTVVEGGASNRKVPAGEAAVDSHHCIDLGEGRSFEVGSSLAGVGTAAVVALRILRGIGILDNLTSGLCRGYDGEERKERQERQ